MALIVLSDGSVSKFRMRVVSMRTLVTIGVFSLLIASVAAFAIGLGVGRNVLQIEALAIEAINKEPELIAVFDVDRPEAQTLISRVGHLTGRLSKLESDTRVLAKRMKVLNDYEVRLNVRLNAPTNNAYENIRPATPAGGPMIPPVTNIPTDPVEFINTSIIDLSSEETEYEEDYGSGLAQLERDLDQMAKMLELLHQVADQRHVSMLSFPSRTPVPGVKRGSHFGNRTDPFTGRRAFHSGLDFPAPRGTPIVASAGGRVVYSGYRGDYGYTVEIDHGNSIITRYAHCSKLLAKVGDIVSPNQKIAEIGSTGRSTGSHLHFEVIKDGFYSNPTRYLASTDIK